MKNINYLNYIMEERGILFKYIIYVDKKINGNYALDIYLKDIGLFKVYNIWYKGEFEKNDYYIIFVKIRKKIANKFIECLNKLRNKMLIEQDQEYFDACKKLHDMINEMENNKNGTN